MSRIILTAILLCASGLAQTPPVRQFLFRIEPVRKDFTLTNITKDELPIVNQHVEYLQKLYAAGTMVLAGQAFDPKGFFGIIVVEAADTESATAIMNDDPLVKNKLFRGEAIPFRTVFERRRAEQQKEASIDPKLLDGYVGRYQLAPEFVLTITREGDGLYAQATNQPKFPVYAKSDREFFFKVVDAQLTFEPGPSGKAVSLTLQQNGAHMPAKRIE